MLVRILLVLVSINTIASQLCMKQGMLQLGGVRSATDFPRVIAGAASSPWILASVCLQVVGYLMWFVIVTREKLGIAVAFSGASLYLLMAISSWVFFGETLNLRQCAGIALIILGVLCIGAPRA